MRKIGGKTAGRRPFRTHVSLLCVVSGVGEDLPNLEEKYTVYLIFCCCRSRLVVFADIGNGRFSAKGWLDRILRYSSEDSDYVRFTNRRIFFACFKRSYYIINKYFAIFETVKRDYTVQQMWVCIWTPHTYGSALEFSRAIFLRFSTISIQLNARMPPATTKRENLQRLDVDKSEIFQGLDAIRLSEITVGDAWKYFQSISAIRIWKEVRASIRSYRKRVQNRFFIKSRCILWGVLCEKNAHGYAIPSTMQTF